MTLGIEVIKFLLEQHPDNLPIVQKWVDKWFWRGHRLLGLVAMMMDYMLPKKVMSWKEAWDIYFTEAGGSLFQDLARYGLQVRRNTPTSPPPKPNTSPTRTGRYSTSIRTPRLSIPGCRTRSISTGCRPNIPTPSTNTIGRAGRCGRRWRRRASASTTTALPQLCQCCQIPMGYTEPGDPTTICFRSSKFKGQTYHFCSDGCKDIFDGEPEKFVQAWLPVQQIFQGNCGGATVPDVLNWYQDERRRGQHGLRRLARREAME